MGPLLLVAVLAAGQSDKKPNWLTNQQHPSGAWTVDGKPDAGATGLALLALLSAGYDDRGSIKDNRYVQNVRRGLRYLAEHRGATARDRAIATLALCEAYWMTRNPRYKKPAERGLAALDGGDDPVTRAFVVAALKSGRFAKLDVPDERLERERKWLDRHGPRHPAAALFSRVLLATDDVRKDERVRRAVELLFREEPPDPITWFFGTIGTFLVGGTAWRRWNETMKEKLIRTQRPDGSWDGDVEKTALYVCCVCVYYRYDRVFGVKGHGEKAIGPRGRSSLAPLTSRIELDDGRVLPLQSVSARVRVEGFRARVSLSLDFFYDGDDLGEGKFQLRLPDGASPHALAFGSAAKETARDAASVPYRMKSARMVDRKRARRAYSTIVRERRDPALLEWDGAGVFTTRVFPLEPRRLHRIELGFDIDLPPGDRFELVLPKTKRREEQRIVRTHASSSTMTGGGYTAVRVAGLPEGWDVEAAALAGCTDALVSGVTVAARGEAAAGAVLDLRLRAGEKTRTWSTTLPAPVASTLTPRVYGEIAVEKLEAFARHGVGVPEAFARHFRVVRATCSLVMLESEKDYERFGIRDRDDGATVRRTAVARWLESRRRATPKQLLRWRIQTLGEPTDLLEQAPDSDFDGLARDGKSFAELARACERRGRPRLALVYDTLARGRLRLVLCAQLLATEREGFWFEYARKALGVDKHELVVVAHWADAARADVDLHVVDPFGDVCNWRRPAGTGGRLDADWTRGPGPEIYRLHRAEPGEYVVRVNYFRPAGATRAHVVAIAGGKVVHATVELARRDQMVEALRITIPER